MTISERQAQADAALLLSKAQSAFVDYLVARADAVVARIKAREA